MIVILSVRLWTASETAMKIGAQHGERGVAETGQQQCRTW
jgi:hypothetical protein